MITRPNFFIIGAPKCGTTALAGWLSGHPSVFVSARKEPHFFNRDQVPAITSLADYEALFAGVGEHHEAVGEASTHYLYSRLAVPAVVDYSPAARFVVCVRNPLEMAPALHRECLRQGWEDVRDFESAWRLQEARRAGRRVPSTVAGDPERLQYGYYCRLGERLQRLYEMVEPSRVVVVVLDDVRENPGCEYRRVLDHLGVGDDGRASFPAANPGVETRSLLASRLIRRVSQWRDALGVRVDWGVAAALRRLNSRRGAAPPPTGELRRELRAYFSDDVALLCRLLDRDLSSWLD